MFIESFTFVHLIHASLITTSVLGAVLLWLTKPKEYQGIAIMLVLVAFAASINILEETGVTRDFYLLSPIFIMLFGPVIYLAIKLLIEKQLARKELWHLLPVLPLLFVTSYTDAVIAIGTFWRLAYAVATGMLVLRYKQLLDEQRSDADDFSLQWLIWILVITSAFNLVDLIRLNMQSYLAAEVNILGQGMNNMVWLIVIMVIIVKLLAQKQVPAQKQTLQLPSNSDSSNYAEDKAIEASEDYSVVFAELDKLVCENQWFLTQRLSLNDLSKLTGLQTRDISRAINLQTEKSFNEYVNQYRVDYVCALLASGKKTKLITLSSDAGFSSKASFNKVFKQLVGLTPTQYKAQNSV